MILARWLDARRPVPPAALRSRIDVALGADLDADTGDASGVLLDAGERLVRSLLEAEATSREAALDLLAADALVTYAFEAASERPADLSSRAAAAMRAIAAVSAPFERRGIA